MVRANELKSGSAKTTTKEQRIVAALGDPNENDENERWALDDEEEAAAHPAEEFAHQDGEPQVPIRKEKPTRHPGDPTKEEMDAHCLTHANWRSWCAICNRADLKEDPPLQASQERGTGGFTMPQL